MNRIILRQLYKYNTITFKVLLFLLTSFIIVYFFPKEGQFKYDYAQGKPWQYDNLYAPFDFAIKKEESELAKEREAVQESSKMYFLLDVAVKDSVISLFEQQLEALASNSFSTGRINMLKLKGKEIIEAIYKDGYVADWAGSKTVTSKKIVQLRSGNTVKSVVFDKFIQTKDILIVLNESLSTFPEGDSKRKIFTILSDIIIPNISFDEFFTQKELDEQLKNISLTKGKISKDEIIIFKGDIVEGRKFMILQSYENATKSKIWTASNYNWIVFGYAFLVALALLMLLLFIKRFRLSIFNDNIKVTFIFINVLLIIGLQTLVVKFNIDYLYVVPLTVLPIVVKAFFDARLALFTHILTVLLLGFIVPNSFEFIYLHIIGGIVAILTVRELYKRGNLFISIGQITLIYMLTYFAFSIIKEGNASQIQWKYFVMFAVNGLLSFLSVFFIYFYEKVFGLVSDVTLLELSSTNSKLLQELNEKAPGTFQHSMQVANLAEAAAIEIGANAMLVRTGAMYHDIGKILDPQFFIENQTTGVNPHDDLSAKDSAKVIIDHVIKGVELAKKNKLPDRIIDFIRTHHGTSLVYYFYRKELDSCQEGETVDIKKFKYQGPIPFSKETAILMMCDASEAASKSLKKPTAQSISDLIDAIFEKQQKDNQFINSNITFREIEKIKKVVKTKLMNIYHLRVEYPE